MKTLVNALKLAFLIHLALIMLGCVGPLSFEQDKAHDWPGGQHGLPVDTNGIPYEVTE